MKLLSLSLSCPTCLFSKCLIYFYCGMRRLQPCLTPSSWIFDASESVAPLPSHQVDDSILMWYLLLMFLLFIPVSCRREWTSLSPGRRRQQVMFTWLLSIRIRPLTRHLFAFIVLISIFCRRSCSSGEKKNLKQKREDCWQQTCQISMRKIKII